MIINEIILIVEFKKERILDYFKNDVNFGVNISYIVKSQQLELTHAIKGAKPYIEDDDDFLVLNGDYLIESETINIIISDKSNATIILKIIREDTKRYGIVIAKAGEVIKIFEKPKTEMNRLLNTEVYRYNSANSWQKV